ncbi:MAG TPA: carbamoyltransferase C-terminal domain-containing protein [Candidatus Sulfopaludibacter sp.]|jgi:carbamoyltransferase|nr:carbamoyltransferase C-terminal domain-containing protein [Candidatus Sulfopaludibacter sp.]
MIILGIGGIGGDAACAILKDGKLAAAVEESKLARHQSHSREELPEHAMAVCLDLAGVKPEQVDAVALVRPLPGPEFHLKVRDHFSNSRVVVLEHHLAHAASAYYPSPFTDATVLVLDRGGDVRCGSRWRAGDAQMTIEDELYVPDSLGEVYGRVTELLGFEASADEHKVQWLSVSGDERFRDLFLEVLSLTDHGVRINRSFLSTERMGHGGFGPQFYSRLGLEDGAAIPEHLRAHIAAGVQKAVEAAAIRMAGCGANLCFAGGLGLNSLLVSALESSAAFKNVFVQPVSGNAGTAIGAVLETWHGTFKQQHRVALETLCLGPAYSAAETKQVLENCKLRFRYLLTTEEVIDTAVAQLSDNKIVAWMHGRMEFGARALGNRSILASPLNPYSTENLNIFIKHREPFRKFAASVPSELAAEYFDVGPNARYLSTVGLVKPQHRERFAAAMLAGDRVRVHTVDREENPLYWKLLHAAGKATGLPVLYNTSFNLFGEPLVCTPRDAVRSFYSSGIDAMFVGQFFLQK